MIKAIPTKYSGITFRSRLEARWAVFFDALGIEWEYEAEGYEIEYGNGNVYYLPDFRLKNVQFERDNTLHDVHVEVKGCDDRLRADGNKIYCAIDFAMTPVSSGLLLLGPVPKPPEFAEMVYHQILYHRKGVEAALVAFHQALRLDRPSEWVASWRLRLSPDQWEIDFSSCDLPDCSVEAAIHYQTWKQDGKTRGSYPDENLVKAYSAARGARFEHGHSGAFKA